MGKKWIAIGIIVMLLVLSVSPTQSNAVEIINNDAMLNKKQYVGQILFYDFKFSTSQYLSMLTVSAKNEGNVTSDEMYYARLYSKGVFKKCLPLKFVDGIAPGQTKEAASGVDYDLGEIDCILIDPKEVTKEKKLLCDHYLGDYHFSDVVLDRDELSLITMQVKNEGNQTLKGIVGIALYSKNKLLLTMLGYFGDEVEPGEKRTITSYTDMNIEAADYMIIQPRDFDSIETLSSDIPSEPIIDSSPTPTIAATAVPTATATVTAEPTATTTVTTAPTATTTVTTVPTTTTTVTTVPTTTTVSTATPIKSKLQKPLGVSANVEGKKVVIKWKNNKNDMMIYRSNSSNGTFKRIAVVSNVINQYEDNNVKRGKKYYYKLCEVQGVQQSEYSSAVKAKINEYPAPKVTIKVKKYSKNINFALIKIKKYQGKKLEIFYLVGNKGKYKKVYFDTNDIKKKKKTFRIGYKKKYKMITFRIRTYEKTKGVRKNSDYCYAHIKK